MSEFDGTVQDDSGTTDCCACEPVSVEPVPIVEEIPPVPVVEEVAPPPAVEEVAPAAVVGEVAPAPVEEPAAAPVAEASPQAVGSTAPEPAAPLVIEPAPGLEPAATDAGDLSETIASSSAQTGVSLNAEGGVVIGPDPNDTYNYTPVVPQWTAEQSAAAMSGPPAPDVIPSNNGLGSLTHPYPGFTRVTSPDGTVNFYGEGYIGPVTPRRNDA